MSNESVRVLWLRGDGVLMHAVKRYDLFPGVTYAADGSSSEGAPVPKAVSVCGEDLPPSAAALGGPSDFGPQCPECCRRLRPEDETLKAIRARVGQHAHQPARAEFTVGEVGALLARLDANRSEAPWTPS